MSWRAALVEAWEIHPLTPVRHTVWIAPNDLRNLCAGSWFHSGEAVTADFFRFKPNVVERCGLLLVLLVS
jgi:hypothetical protein